MNSLETKHYFVKTIRNYFDEQGLMEVITPPMVTCPGIEPHLVPFQIQASDNQKTPYYLHTSPEFFLKKVLSQYHQSIYSLGFSFRDEPESENHRPQFLMLEWYRIDQDLEVVKQDCKNLIENLYRQFNLNKEVLKFESKSVSELFLEFVGFDFLEINSSEDWIRQVKNFNPSYLSSAKELTEWEDFFFLLFLNLVEPQFKNYPFLFVTDFPAQLAALSRLQPDSRLCHRFELYINGLEVANCYQELTCHAEQLERYKNSQAQAQRLYQRNIPEPIVLLQALKTGLPVSSGIALGVDRLLKAMNLVDNPFYTET